MSKQEIQQAIAEQLERSEGPMTVGELLQNIRQQRPEFRKVADFDFRSAVLAMRISGAVRSISTNQIAAPTKRIA